MWYFINWLEEVVLVLLAPLYIIYYKVNKVDFSLKCKECGKWLLVPIYFRLGLCLKCHRKFAEDTCEKYYTNSEYGRHEFSGEDTKQLIYSRRTDHENLYNRLAQRVGDGMTLDIGCGYGPILSRVSERLEHDLYGIEMRKEPLLIAKQIVGQGEFCVSRGQNIPFKSDVFDNIVCSEVLEHLSEIQGNLLLSECFRVLKPGGKALFTVPNGRGISGELPYHIRFFSYRSFVKIIQEAGYHIFLGQKYGLWIPFLSRFMQILLLVSNNRLPLNSYINIRVPEILCTNFMVECYKPMISKK